MFVPGKPLQPSVMFTIKAEDYLNGAPLKKSTLILFNQGYPKHEARLEKLARDKHSSLLQRFVTYGRKKFYNIMPRLRLNYLCM